MSPLIVKSAVFKSSDWSEHYITKVYKSVHLCLDDEPVLEGNISVPGTVGAPDGAG